MSTLDHLALVFGCTATATIVSALYGPSFVWVGLGLYAIVRRFPKEYGGLRLIKSQVSRFELERNARLAEPAGRRNRSIS